MPDAGLAATLIETLKEAVEILFKHEILSRLMFTALSLLVLSIFLFLYKALLDKMVEARKIHEDAATRLYKMVELAAVVLILMAIAYFVTRSKNLLLFTAAVILIVLAASWQLIINFIYYYIVQFSGYLRKGNLLVLNDGRAGKIEDLKSLGLVLSRIGPPRQSYFIPYKELFSNGFTVAEDSCIVRVRVHVEGVSPELLDTLKDVIERRAFEAGSQVSVVAHVEEVLRPYVEELTSNSATFVVTFVTPQIGGREFRLAPILHLLALALREAGYTKFRVELERPECPGGK